MPRFEVQITHTLEVIQTVEVEADSYLEAEDKAYDLSDWSGHADHVQSEITSVNGYD